MPEENKRLEQRRAIQAFYKTIDQESYVLKNNPELTFPQIYNRLLGQAGQIVTPVRIWILKTDNEAYGWDDSIKTTCHWCGKRFAVAETVLDDIRAIAYDADPSSEKSSHLGLPAEAWDDPRLLSECPLCHNPLRFNPFLVDNRDRR